MIKAASVGLGWWSDELAESIQGKSKKIKIVSCYSRSKKKRINFSKKYAPWIILLVVIICIGLISNIWLTLIILVIIYIISIIYTVMINFKSN